MKYISTFIILFFIASVSCISAQSTPCQNQEIFKKLDFWVGEWDVLNPQGQPAGTNKITKILNGCAIMEEWTGSGPSRGNSLNFYNPQSKQWQQVWVDNSASPLYFDGVTGQDSMIYTGSSLNTAGQKVVNEMILSKINDNKVRQLWRQSLDAGNTWTIAFDGFYNRKK